MPSEHLRLHPKLVVPCTLDGVEPKEDRGWSDVSLDYFESLLTTYKYKLSVTFLAQKGDLYMVSMKKGNGDSVADNLMRVESGQVKIVTSAIHEHVLNFLK